MDALVQSLHWSSLADSEAARTRRLAEVGLRSSALMHDLNNFLQIVAGNLDRLAKEGLDEGSASRLANAREGLSRCVRLARRDLRRDDREEHGEVVVVADLLHGLRHHLHSVCGTGISVEVSIDEPELQVEVDALGFENAIINLAVNARDAMRGEGRLRIVGRRASPDEVSATRPMPPTVVIEVADDGPGIDPRIQSEVFRPFFTTKATGTGLGLANVRAFVERAGGSMILRSQHGRGTAALLTFPLVPRRELETTMADPVMGARVAMRGMTIGTASIGPA